MTLTERGAKYFGVGNVARLQTVHLGRGRVAFVDAKRLWIYEERVFTNTGIVVNLTPTMRANLLDALGVEVAA